MGGWTSSSGGIWALWGKKRSRTLPTTATERPFPEPGRRSCGRDKCEVSQEVGKAAQEAVVSPLTHTCCLMASRPPPSSSDVSL